LGSCYILSLNRVQTNSKMPSTPRSQRVRPLRFFSWVFLLLVWHASYDNMGRIFVILVKTVFSYYFLLPSVAVPKGSSGVPDAARYGHLADSEVHRTSSYFAGHISLSYICDITSAEKLIDRLAGCFPQYQLCTLLY